MERKPISLSMTGGTIILVLGIAAMYALLPSGDRPGAGTAAPMPMIATAEYAPLRRASIDGRSWLVHPTLGFRIADPGTHFVIPAAELRSGSAMWTLRDAVHSQRLLVSLSVMPPITPEVLAALVEATRRHLVAIGATVDGVTSTYAPGHSVCEIPFTLHEGHAVTRFDTFQIAAERPRREIAITLLGPATNVHDVITSFVPP